MLQQKSLIKLVHTVFYLIKSSIKKKKNQQKIATFQLILIYMSSSACKTRWLSQRFQVSVILPCTCHSLKSSWQSLFQTTPYFRQQTLLMYLPFSLLPLFYTLLTLFSHSQKDVYWYWISQPIPHTWVLVKERAQLAAQVRSLPKC